jgi:hypothetical protein
MKTVHLALILIVVVIGGALLFAATFAVIYKCLTTPRNYGITEIKFESTRLWPVIKIVAENNRSTSITIVAVFVNSSKVSNDPAIYPNIYPRLPVTIQPNTRTALQIESYYWAWSDPLGTKYAYNVTLVADDGDIFTKTKETPYPPQ